MEKKAPNPEAKKIAEMIAGRVFGRIAAHAIADQIRNEECGHVGKPDEGKPQVINISALSSHPRDLQTIISDYLFLLDSIKDPYARGVIKSQLTDLTDLQYQQLTGENENA